MVEYTKDGIVVLPPGMSVEEFEKTQLVQSRIPAAPIPSEYLGTDVEQRWRADYVRMLYGEYQQQRVGGYLYPVSPNIPIPKPQEYKSPDAYEILKSPPEPGKYESVVGLPGGRYIVGSKTAVEKRIEKQYGKVYMWNETLNIPDLPVQPYTINGVPATKTVTYDPVASGVYSEVDVRVVSNKGFESGLKPPTIEYRTQSEKQKMELFDLQSSFVAQMPQTRFFYDAQNFFGNVADSLSSSVHVLAGASTIEEERQRLFEKRKDWTADIFSKYKDYKTTGSRDFEYATFNIGVGAGLNVGSMIFPVQEVLPAIKSAKVARMIKLTGVGIAAYGTGKTLFDIKDIIGGEKRYDIGGNILIAGTGLAIASAGFKAEQEIKYPKYENPEILASSVGDVEAKIYKADDVDYVLAKQKKTSIVKYSPKETKLLETTVGNVLEITPGESNIMSRGGGIAVTREIRTDLLGRVGDRFNINFLKYKGKPTIKVLDTKAETYLIGTTAGTTPMDISVTYPDTNIRGFNPDVDIKRSIIEVELPKKELGYTGKVIDGGKAIGRPPEDALGFTKPYEQDKIWLLESLPESRLGFKTTEFIDKEFVRRHEIMHNVLRPDDVPMREFTSGAYETSVDALAYHVSDKAFYDEFKIFTRPNIGEWTTEFRVISPSGVKTAPLKTVSIFGNKIDVETLSIGEVVARQSGGDYWKTLTSDVSMTRTKITEIIDIGGSVPVPVTTEQSITSGLSLMEKSLRLKVNTETAGGIAGASLKGVATTATAGVLTQTQAILVPKFTGVLSSGLALAEKKDSMMLKYTAPTIKTKDLFRQDSMSKIEQKSIQIETPASVVENLTRTKVEQTAVSKSLTKTSSKLATNTYADILGGQAPPTRSPITTTTVRPPIFGLKPTTTRKRMTFKPTIKRTKTSYSYRPSLGGVFSSKTIKKAPKGKLTGLGIRYSVKRNKNFRKLI